MSSDRHSELDGSLLLAFQALLREQNVTRAAEALSLSQPALSGRLARLRSLFGDSLFVPSTTGRGMVPTERACALGPDVDAAIDALRSLLGPSAEFDPSTSQRTFVVALPENPAVMLMPDLVPLVRQRAPQVSLASVFPTRATIAEDLEQGRVDLLIDVDADVPEDWMMRPLLDEGFATAQRRGHPRGTSPLDLDAFCEADHLLISAEGGGFSGLVDEALLAHGRRRRVSVSVQSYALAPLILRHSDHLCTLPRRLLARFGDDLDIYDPPFEMSRFRVSMYWHPRSQDDKGHAWLREQVVSAATRVEANEAPLAQLRQ